MPAIALYTPDQLEFIRRSYLSRRLPPREVARLVNEKFRTSYSTKQISAACSERGWTARRKIARIRAANTMDIAILAKGEQRAELATVRDIVEGHARVGATITAKAEKFANDATSAKTLSSAASAAKVGISITRTALGLDQPGSHSPTHTTFNINFAHGPGSPFTAEAQEQARLEAMKKAQRVDESGLLENGGLSVNEEPMKFGAES